MSRLNKNTRALLLLWGVTLATCLIVFHRFLFGDEFFVFSDVGSDTLQQYLMQYNSIINALRDKSLSLWDFTNGLGTSLYALNLFHPLLFLLYLAGAVVGPMRVPYLMVYLEIGQIFLAVTVFYFYLKEFPVTVKTRVIAAYLYGFNGYLLVWGQHYQFGLYVILLPFLLLLVERALKKRKFSFSLALAVSFTVLASVYMSYMTLLTVGIYLLIRLLSMDGPVKSRARLFFQNCGSILLGIGMIMAVFLPSAFYIMNISSRLDNSGSILTRFLENLTPYSPRFYETAFYRLFSSNLCGISENYTGVINYYEAPVLFVSVLFVILFVQYLFTIHRQDTFRKWKVLQYISIVLALFVLFTKAGSMAYNAFAYAFSRHTFVLMPFAVLIMAFTLDQIFCRRRFSWAGLCVSGLLFVLLYMKNPGTAQASTLFICILGALMAAVLVLGCRKKKQVSPVLLSAFLLGLVMVNMSYDSYHTCNDRATLKKDDGNYFEQLYGQDVTAALEYLRSIDASFYRVEKDYDGGSYCMDALTQNYFGVSTYNSAPNKNIQEFVNKLWPGLIRMSPSMFSYRQTVYDSGMASLLNVKYLLSHNPSLDVDNFTLLEQFGSIYIYKNENTESIGKFYTKTLSEEQLPEDTSGLDMDRLLNDLLILNSGQRNASSDTHTGTEADPGTLSEYTLDKLDYEIGNYKFSGVTDFPLLPDPEKLSGYERVYMDFDLKFHSDAVVSIQSNASSVHYVSGKKKETVHVRLRLPKSCDQITVTSTSGTINGVVKNIFFYGSKAPLSRNSEADVDFDMPVRDTHVEGRVNAKSDGVLMASIPYEEGWSAYLDGKRVPLLRGDYGFAALDMPAGEHTVVFEYHAPGLTAGLCISALCIILFLILLAFRLIHESKKNA